MVRSSARSLAEPAGPVATSRSPTSAARDRAERDVDDRAGDSDGLVSVVLPTDERGSGVTTAIESVLAQSYERFELLVVDGGSTDGTHAVVESIDDPRVRYTRRAELTGVSAARNVGVQETDGEFVAFIDPEDRWHPDKLRRQVAVLRMGGPDYAVAYTGVEKAAGEPRTREGESGDVAVAVRRMAVPTSTSTLLVRRRALVGCGGFDEALPCFADWELCLRLAADHAFAYLSDPLVAEGTPGDTVSAEPDRVITAVHRVRTKHDLPEETLARLLEDAGVTACEAGQFDRGQTYLREALRRDPSRPGAVAAFLLSLPASPAVFDGVMDRIAG